MVIKYIIAILRSQAVECLHIFVRYLSGIEVYIC